MSAAALAALPGAVRPDFGDGGLAALGLLVILAVATLFAWTGVMIVCETMSE